MPIDPSIPLNAGRGVAQLNPLQTLTQAAQMRYMNANANQLTQAINANRAMSGILQNNTDANGNINYPGVVRDASQNPDAAYNLPQLVQSINAQKQQNVTLQSTQQALASKKWGALGNFAANFMTNPNATGADYVSGVTNMANQGVIDAPTALKQINSVLPYLDDPAKLKQIVRQELAGLPPEVQEKYILPQIQTVNNGMKTNVVKITPITGNAAITGSIDNTVSPNVAITRTPTFQNGTPGTIPLGSAPGSAPYVGPVPGTGVQDGVKTPGFIPTGPALGVEAAADVAGKGSGSQLAADRAQAGSSNQRIYQLQSALSGLENSSTGPGTETTHQIASFLLSQTPADLGKYLPGVNVKEIKSYDEANKYLTQYAMAKAGAMGQGTDQKLAAAFTGNANTHISNLAAQDVVKANIGLERMEQAKIEAFDNALASNKVTAKDYATWSAQWSKYVDPRVFISDQLSGPQFASMVKSMKPSDLAQFRTQYNAAVANGLISGKQ